MQVRRVLSISLEGNKAANLSSIPSPAGPAKTMNLLPHFLPAFGWGRRFARKTNSGQGSGVNPKSGTRCWASFPSAPLCGGLTSMILGFFSTPNHSVGRQSRDWIEPLHPSCGVTKTPKLPGLNFLPQNTFEKDVKEVWGWQGAKFRWVICLWGCGDPSGSTRQAAALYRWEQNSQFPIELDWNEGFFPLCCVFSPVGRTSVAWNGVLSISNWDLVILLQLFHLLWLEILSWQSPKWSWKRQKSCNVFCFFLSSKYLLNPEV